MPFRFLQSTARARRLLLRLTCALVACCIVVPTGEGAEVGVNGVAPLSAPAVLTNVQQVVALGRGVATGHHEAHLQCIVLFVSPGMRRLYAQAGDRGIQLNLPDSVASYRVGQLIAATGTVLEAEPLLRLGNVKVEVLGTAPLPAPKEVSPHRLITGAEPFRFVGLRGVVRDMVSDRNRLLLLVTHEGLPFEVSIGASGEPLPRHWLDAEIEVRGFSYPFYNGLGRPTGFRFNAADTRFVTLLGSGVPDRFGRPLLTIAEAARLPQEWGPRVKVAGTVTVHRPGIAFFIDDGTGVMHVDLLRHLAVPTNGQHLDHEPQTWLQPGERVEVIGVRHNWYSLTPTLIFAEYRRVGRSAPVAPVPVTIRDLREGRHSGRLVTLEARLLDQRAWGSVNMRYQALVLRSGDDIFQARWESEVPAEWNLEPDGYVRITGVNDAEGSVRRKGSTFQLLLRSPEDVAAAAEPPFWARPEVRRVAIGAFGAGVLAAAWIAFQRWQMGRLESRVTDRTADLSRANEQLQREVQQRRAAEESLRASEARKAAVLETALDSIITIDGRGCILDFNPAAERTFGFARAEVLGREMTDLLVPSSMRERHREGLRRAVETGADAMLGRRIEMLAMRRTGEEFPVELALARITTEAGPIFTAQIQDISDRKRSESIQRALYEISEAVPAADDLQSLYARIHAVISTLMRADNFYLALRDEETGIVSFPYHRDLVDPPPAPRKGGRGMTEYVLRTGRPTLANLAEIQRLKDTGEYRQSGHPAAIWLGVPLTLEGCTFGVMAVQDQGDPAAFDDEDKRILSFVAGQTALAIERKRREEALRASTRRLRESEERFGKAFRSTPAVLSIMRMADERLIEVNEAFLKASGFAEQEVVGRTTTELNLWADPDQRAEFLRMVRERGYVHSFEARLLTKHRREETVLMSAEPIILDGEPCLLAVSVLVTEQKRAEENLARALAHEKELGELKSRFVSMVSHEFRTPLGIIMSSAEILESYLDRLPPEERRANLRDIFQSSRHMASMMEEVLLLGRVEAGKMICRPAPLDLAMLCAKLADEVRSATGGRCPIELETGGGLEDAVADESLLRHILTNLLNNAVKYSAPGVPVRFVVGSNDRAAVFRVRDQGIGIPEADQKQLFDAFHRGLNVGEVPGTGLGMVIVKHCVELHGGRIEFESREGQGTSFMVTLPIIPPSGGSAPSFAHAAASDIAAEVSG